MQSLLATNTIAQGDTREVGLDQLVADGCSIPRAVPSRRWPGTASLEVAHIWLRKDTWRNKFILDEKLVSGITPFLTVSSKATGNPYRLVASQGKSFIGSYVLGMGFVLTPEEAQALIDKNPKNKDVLFPYLNGEDLNSRPDQSPSRWVINFFDWPLNWEMAPKDYKGQVAADYPDCLEIVKERVKPERDKLGLKNDSSAKGYAKFWWQYARKGIELYATIAGMERVLVRARIANIHSMAFVSDGWVYNEKTVIFASCSFTVLQSNIHEVWAREYSSSLKTDMQYTPSDCFETFSFPAFLASTVSLLGEKYHEHRRLIMFSRQEGLTKTYNRFHNPNETSLDIEKLRELHKEMDEAVANAYGWGDLDLGHGFHQTKQGTRYTICEEARREVLDRLLELNHERYAEEVAAGLHDTSKGKKKAASTSKSKASKAKAEEAEEVQGSLF